MIDNFFMVLLCLLVASICVASENYEYISANCTSSQYMCSNGQCIELSQQCDENLDCDDGTDEDNCCKSDELRCSSACVLKSLICDGVVDCDDGLDERNCGTLTCAASEFACVNSRKCVPNAYRCDNNYDCPMNEDEENCTSQVEDEVTSSCAGSEFRCVSNGQCIASDLRCDGSRNCGDGSDEVNCTVPSAHCEADKFACRASAGLEAQCVSLKRRCDKFIDCPHGDDESDCGSLTDKNSYDIDSKPLFICDQVTQFKCWSTDTCISKAAVCNNVSDCLNGEDEQNCEVNPERDPCSPSDLGLCSHLCVSTTRNGLPRYQCGCKAGFRLAGPYVCADVDECASDVSLCSHRCENTPGSYLCSCEANYKLDEVDKRTCRANVDGDKLLFVLTPNQLRAQRIGASEWLSLRNMTNANAFDFDVSMQLVFWSAVQRDGGSQRKAGVYMSNWAMQSVSSAQQQAMRHRIDLTLDLIKKTVTQADVKSKQVEEFLRQMKGGAMPSRTVVALYEDPKAEIEAVAFDWLNKLVFWTDSYYRHVVAFSLLTGRSHIVLSGLRKPGAVALDPAFGTIYLIDGTDKDVSISSLAMDGSDRVNILDNFDSMPRALTIDYSMRRLLFVDSERSFIRSCSLDVPSAAIGATCRLVHSFGTASSAKQPSFSTQTLSTFEDELYWIEGQPAALRACSRSSCATAQRTLLPENYDVRGVSVVHTLRQQTVNTPCLTTTGYQCPFMCLPTRRNRSVDALSARCVCGQGENFVAGSLPLTGKCVGEAKNPQVPTTDAPPRPAYDLPDGEVTVDVSEEGFEFGRVAIVIGVLLGVVIVAILIAVLVYRSYSRRDGKAMSMNFENPVFGKPISIAMPQFYATGGGSSMVDIAGNNYALSDPDADRPDEHEMEAFPDAERGSGSMSYTASPIRRPLNVTSDPSETHRLTEAGDSLQTEA